MRPFKKGQLLISKRCPVGPYSVVVLDVYVSERYARGPMDYIASNGGYFYQHFAVDDYRRVTWFEFISSLWFLLRVRWWWRRNRRKKF